MKFTWKKFFVGCIVILLILCLGSFLFPDSWFILTGWKPLIEGVAPHQLAVSESGSLVAIDYKTETLYYFPQGSDNPDSFSTYPFERDDIEFPCFFDRDQKLLFSRGEITIFNLDSGEFEPLDEQLDMKEGFDCTTLNNGDMVVAALGKLAFYSDGEWELVENPVLDTAFEVAQRDEGAIWVGLRTGYLYSYDLETQQIELVVDLNQSEILEGLVIQTEFHKILVEVAKVDPELEQPEPPSQSGMLLELDSLPGGNVLIDSYGQLFILWINDDGVTSSKIPDLRGDYWRDRKTFNIYTVVDSENGIIWQGIYDWGFLKLNNEIGFIRRYFPFGGIFQVAYDSEAMILYVGASEYDSPAVIYYRDVSEIVGKSQE